MSPTRDDIIIIDGLIATGQLPAQDVQCLTEIREKPEGRCTAKDADTVARIVRKALRKPKPL